MEAAAARSAELQPETRLAAWKALQEAEEGPQRPLRIPLPRGRPPVTASTLGAPPPAFLTSCFHSSPLPRLVLPPAPEPTSPARSEEAGASHEPFVLGPLRVGRALPAPGSSLPRRSPVPSPTTCRPAGASARRPGWRLERGAATPEDSRVAKTWRPREPEGPAGAGAKEPQTCSRKEAKPGAFPLPPLTLPAPEAAQGLAVGPQCPEEPGCGEMLLNGLLEVPIKIMFTNYFGYLTTETCTE